MGQTISVTQTSKNVKMQQFIKKLQFVQNINDNNFGHIDIYRLKQPPYEYLMDYQKIYIQGNNSYIKYINYMNQLSKTEHKNLAKIHLTQLKQQKQLCIKNKKTHTFCNYYNFTLSEAINKKKQQQAIFTQQQLVYIMGCLLDLAQYLKKVNMSIGQYKASSIYLSPQGYIKMYLLELDQQNKHSCYYKALIDRSMIDSFILAPEQLKLIEIMQNQIAYDVYQADLFAIGFIIFQLITQDDIKFYYNEQRNNYKFDRIAFDIDAISKIYSNQFIQLIAFCLIEDPHQRITLQQASSILNNIKKNCTNCTYCIRLHDDDNKKKNKIKKQSIMSSPKAPLGNFTKLTPSPITTLSSSYSSSIKGQSININSINNTNSNSYRNSNSNSNSISISNNNNSNRNRNTNTNSISISNNNNSNNNNSNSNNSNNNSNNNNSSNSNNSSVYNNKLSNNNNNNSNIAKYQYGQKNHSTYKYTQLNQFNRLGIKSPTITQHTSQSQKQKRQKVNPTKLFYVQKNIKM